MKLSDITNLKTVNYVLFSGKPVSRVREQLQQSIAEKRTGLRRDTTKPLHGQMQGDQFHITLNRGFRNSFKAKMNVELAGKNEGTVIRIRMMAHPTVKSVLTSFILISLVLLFTGLIAWLSGHETRSMAFIGLLLIVLTYAISGWGYRASIKQSKETLGEILAPLEVKEMDENRL